MNSFCCNNDVLVDIWFGPGAVRGVFGAGVAAGLQIAFDRGQLSPGQIQLYGSSVGCLTSAFLATGNTGCGLDIFTEDTRELIAISKLIPATCARSINFFTGRISQTGPKLAVPHVLNVDHVFRVLNCRTPDLVEQLRSSPMRVHAETVERQGRVRHVELGAADNPLAEIRNALHAFPFSYSPENPLFDSAIGGYGFVELLVAPERPLIIVLNDPVRERMADSIADLACAVLSGDRHVARLYLKRRRQQRSAARQAHHADQPALLITPERVIRTRRLSEIRQAHAAGINAAQQVVAFIQSHRAMKDGTGDQVNG